MLIPESENLETGNIHYEVRAWSEPDGWVPSLGSYFLPQGRSAMSKGIWILTYPDPALFPGGAAARGQNWDGLFHGDPFKNLLKRSLNPGEKPSWHANHRLEAHFQGHIL